MAGGRSPDESIRKKLEVTAGTDIISTDAGYDQNWVKAAALHHPAERPSLRQLPRLLIYIIHWAGVRQKRQRLQLPAPTWRALCQEPRSRSGMSVHGQRLKFCSGG